MGQSDFEKYCKSRGKTPYNLKENPLANNFLKAIEVLLDRRANKIRPQFPKIPKLVWGFLEDATFNAGAAIDGDTAIITINCGLPTVLANLFRMLLTHKAAFQMPRKINFTEKNSFRCKEVDLYNQLFNGGQLLDYEGLWPSDRVRASNLATACCYFVFFHEFIHIRDGHVDLHRQANPLTAIDELSSQANAKLTALDYQSFEWDADKIGHWLAGDIGITTILGRSFVDCPPQDQYRAFREFHISIYVMFKLFHLCEDKTAPPDERKHPSPVVRMSTLLMAVPKLASLLKIEVKFPDFQVDVMRSGELAWAMITGQSVSSSVEFAKAMEREMGAQIALLLNWGQLRKRLEPLQRGATELSQPEIIPDPPPETR